MEPQFLELDALIYPPPSVSVDDALQELDELADRLMDDPSPQQWIRRVPRLRWLLRAASYPTTVKLIQSYHAEADGFPVPAVAEAARGTLKEMLTRWYPDLTEESADRVLDVIQDRSLDRTMVRYIRAMAVYRALEINHLDDIWRDLNRFLGSAL
jgi:hypothetical protein